MLAFQISNCVPPQRILITLSCSSTKHQSDSEFFQVSCVDYDVLRYGSKSLGSVCYRPLQNNDDDDDDDDDDNNNNNHNHKFPILPRDVNPNTTICYMLIGRTERNRIESGFEPFQSRHT